MSFQTGLSGLNASSKNLDVIGNNIANANTVGMKYSRAEFADLVSSSLGTGGGGGSGIGVAVATVSQQFSQGNINITGNSLDVAINGGGFFQITKTDGTTAYTRDGQFKLDKDGNIITNTGANVMGYATSLTGVQLGTTPIKMVLPTGAPIPASATTAITAEFNLDARAPIAATQTPPTPVSTYGTSLTVYDSQGVALPVSLYFVKIDPATATPPVAATRDAWSVFTDPAGTTNVGTLVFDANGALVPAETTFPTDVGGAGTLRLTPVAPSIVPPFDVSVNALGVTQYGASFNVSNLSQDGYTAGELTGVTIEATGVITTRYSNGQTQSRGQIALADFRNVQGLAPVGSGEYLATFTSGQPILGAAGVGKFGELRSGAVEESNVDLTAELVNMMTAQRAYQANAQTIKTQDQVLSTLVNLR
ncbi:flagellar hook protein FlgE [Rhodoferax saidenbachensis]|uniref:Flagellar hook protein FlgE n=1 Tax=Rhodoferax saidenbachensis TaxID=1484693 RepID=A0A1P8K6B5_9BURK|nr:flagellar hook protein FlgE [Rhodoferax saidenbachensis]APW41570.1 flagellar biosynthesis protein FlgE [Rhodoferax saidenbachensis]